MLSIFTWHFPMNEEARDIREGRWKRARERKATTVKLESLSFSHESHFFFVHSQFYHHRKDCCLMIQEISEKVNSSTSIYFFHLRKFFLQVFLLWETKNAKGARSRYFSASFSLHPFKVDANKIEGKYVNRLKKWNFFLFYAFHMIFFLWK